LIGSFTGQLKLLLFPDFDKDVISRLVGMDIKFKRGRLGQRPFSLREKTVVGIVSI
jgi:hypothetical protein